jgi:MOSC domain-containing protein YiiM
MLNFPFVVVARLDSLRLACSSAIDWDMLHIHFIVNSSLCLGWIEIGMAAVFSWLKKWRNDELDGTLTDIFIAEQAGAPMQRVAEIEAVPGLGLAGDRYGAGRGHWKLTDGCQVTLVTEEDLHKVQRRSGISMADGRHRRNLVVRGIPLDAFRQRRVRIGEVLFEFHRLRPPCGYLDRLSGAGVGKALGKGAGIALKVLRGGVLRLGDRVTVLRRSSETAAGNGDGTSSSTQ